MLDESQPDNVHLLLHAPWLRLLSVAGFSDTGDQVILARVSLAAPDWSLPWLPRRAAWWGFPPAGSNYAARA